MYFSDNPSDRYYERMMVGIPNFKPRGHGVVIVGSRPTEPLVILRIQDGTATHREILTETTKAINHRRFRHRLNKYLKESEMNPMRYKNEKHQSEFEEAIRKRDKKDYREILAVADEQGGKLKNRCVFFCDEFGTLPKIESAEMMFSASRSRRLQIVPIIQSFSQLDKNYGKEGAEIIVDNTQLTIFGGFAPNSSSAEVLSKALGTRTVMSGSVSRSRNDPSESLQMIERPLLTPDELKSLPKGQFVVMKTGVHPMRVKLKLFFKWGIEFDEDNPYTVTDHGGREVKYAEKKEIMDGIIKKYHPDWIVKDKPAADGGNGIGGQDQAESESHEPQQTPPKKPGDKKGGGGAVIREKPSAKQTTPLPKPEVKPNEPS